MGIFNWKWTDNFTLPITSQTIWSIYSLSFLSLACIFLMLLSFYLHPPQSIFCVPPFLIVLRYVSPLSSFCAQLLSEVLKGSFCNGLFLIFPTDPFCFTALWCWKTSFSLLLASENLNLGRVEGTKVLFMKWLLSTILTVLPFSLDFSKFFITNNLIAA